MLKIIDNRDLELRELAEQQLRANKEKFGKRYCPCSLEHTQDMLCPCKKFREQSVPGECHCGRYEKVEVDNDLGRSRE